MDPRSFDALIRRCSRVRSRRQLLTGSVVAGLLAVMGIEAEARRRGGAIARCVPGGRLCGKKRRKSCKKCCHRYFVDTAKGKKCSCRPDGLDCRNPSQCCSGACTSGFCGTAATCAELGESCVELDCCDGQCVEIEEELVCEDCLPQGAECSVQEDLCCPQHFCDDETSLCVHVE